MSKYISVNLILLSEKQNKMENNLGQKHKYSECADIKNKIFFTPMVGMENYAIKTK